MLKEKSFFRTRLEAFAYGCLSGLLVGVLFTSMVWIVIEAVSPEIINVGGGYLFKYQSLFTGLLAFFTAIIAVLVSCWIHVRGLKIREKECLVEANKYRVSLLPRIISLRHSVTALVNLYKGHQELGYDQENLIKMQKKSILKEIEMTSFDRRILNDDEVWMLSKLNAIIGNSNSHFDSIDLLKYFEETRTSQEAYEDSIRHLENVSLSVGDLHNLIDEYVLIKKGRLKTSL